VLQRLSVLHAFRAWLLSGLFASTLTAETVLVFGPEHPAPRVTAASVPLAQDAARDLCQYLSRVSGQKIQLATTSDSAAFTIHVGRDGFVAQHAPQIRQRLPSMWVEMVLWPSTHRRLRPSAVMAI